MNDSDTNDDITLNDIEQQLTESKLDVEVGLAEIIDVQPDANGDNPGVVVTFETASGDEHAELLPVPGHYEATFSDLVVLIEFTETDPNDLAGLVGKRVPFDDAGVPWQAMRAVVTNDVVPEDADYMERVRERL